jgi:hypothetical protein
MMFSSARKVLAVLALMLALAPKLPAKIYYASKGVKYHVGDNRYDQSEDATFVGTYPVVGEEWIQAFRVDEADKVKVTIGNIWGVDNCPYCKILVSINEWDMGRITQENNHEPFTTLEPLACSVDAGKTYFLKIASYALGGSSDDFVFSDVTVETQHASVTFLQPGPIIKMPDQPMPKIFEPAPERPASGCDGLNPNRNWMLGWNNGQAAPADLKPDKDFAESGTLAELEPGQSLALSFKAGSQSMNADRVDYAFEVMATPSSDSPTAASKPSGWIFQFHDGVNGLYHGNLKLRGNYSARSFTAPQLDKAGQNQLMLQYCHDGSMHLILNGKALGQSLSGMTGTQAVGARALGVPVLVEGAARQ